MKVIFISITLRDTRAVVHPWPGHELATPPSPTWLRRPGLLQAPDQGNHAVMAWCRHADTAAFGGDAAVENIDFSRLPGQHVLQHAGLVVIGLHDGLIHRLAWRALQLDPGSLADRHRLADQCVYLRAQPGVGA